MKCLLPICLFLLVLIGSVPSGAQDYSAAADPAFIKLEASLPWKEPFDTAHKWKMAKDSFIYIVSDNDLYDLFGYAAMIKYRDIDFTRYHLLGIYTCRPCFLYCRHDLYKNECHRNVHEAEWIWLLRENTKALDILPSVTDKGHIDTDIPHQREEWRDDTVLSRKTLPGYAGWYTTGGGDCHARISYTLYADRYYPVYLLQEWNRYGGCRAAGFWAFTISFPEPGKQRHYIKRRILLDRDGGRQ